MEFSAVYNNQTLRLCLRGEIDEHSVAQIRRKADEAIERYAVARVAIFELDGVSFMDSTGIGFLIGRYKKLQRFGIEAYIYKPDSTADKILMMSGVYTLLPRLDVEAEVRGI